MEGTRGSHDGILRVVRSEKFGAVADALVALAGDADDVAVLVAET